MTNQIEIKKILEKELEILQQDAEVVEFVEWEACKQVAKDVVKLSRDNRCCTPKAAWVLVNNGKNPDMHKRYMQYVACGYAGVIAAKYKQ